MKAIYEDVVQPSPLVLFSSLPISAPFDQASLSIDSQLSSDSFIALLDDTTHQIVSGSSKPLIYYHPTYKPSSSELTRPTNLLGDQDDTWPVRSIVLHIQSPNCKNTFIRLPPLDKTIEFHPVLGIELPYLHLQLKPLDHTFMLEVGVRDQAGDRILIRASTFQTEARSYSRSKSNKSGHTKLIHLPLVFPTSEAYTQTKWNDLLLPLDSLIPTRYHSTDFIQVHASVRLRRIYFTSDGKQASSHSNRNQDGLDLESQQVITAEGARVVSASSVFRPELILFKGSEAQAGAH
ncbi:hypothetical protein PGT21_029475 [Puccinia graminis f. sp. tritici]|uniref:CFA20 domain-containing protein n=3 Tax=Puccinia graminis f. sp. tritici TaxID=56615 RepID=E3KGH7_PUCGT|nr:uncharacterized protein PGTG_08588 [Puccinia graminis f. sp. tritici CRL 75-36-700-3]EFP83402.2 hypothetical protein PGTG_08588 [Puccinia graminis f. sp. tritici CRL 75-36-700-3]KAA1072110.1 hypothetical protein PGT21_028032 [Puccinia graminis f. sp. tritici]KAA1078152.1 hypothetical protein PGT21_029475 [Puccinia graminis f. sp. tritici]